MRLDEILVKPIISEKSQKLAGVRQYVFEVNRKADKNQIKSAIQEIFKVKVLSIAVANRSSKTKVKGRYPIIKRPKSKRAIVSINKAQKIDLFEVQEEKPQKSKAKI